MTVLMSRGVALAGSLERRAAGEAYSPVRGQLAKGGRLVTAAVGLLNRNRKGGPNEELLILGQVTAEGLAGGDGLQGNYTWGGGGRSKTQGMRRLGTGMPDRNRKQLRLSD